MKNAFYFILKSYFVLKILKVFLDFLVMCKKNDLIRNIRLISKFMTFWRRSGIFIVNFEHVSHLVLVFLVLTLSR